MAIVVDKGVEERAGRTATVAVGLGCGRGRWIDTEEKEME